MALLACDLGGTKTKIGVYSLDKGEKKPIIEKTFASARYPDFESVLHEFLSGLDMKFEKAVFGVAGPLLDDKVSITNLPWTIDKKKLKSILKIPSLELLNDLEALGYAVSSLDPKDLFTLNQGRTDPAGNIAVIAPGTGLGEAFLTRDKNQYKASATEGGHADFAPANSLQIRLLQYLWDRFSHVSYEKVCSGSGIQNIYDFLKTNEQMEEPEWLTLKLSKANDPTPVILDAAINDTHNCKICTAALDLFISILGAETGNLALKTKATGGVYLGGGIPPRIIFFLKNRAENGAFMEAFKQKGSMTYLLERIPVHVILNPDAVLSGCAAYGFTL